MGFWGKFVAVALWIPLLLWVAVDAGVRVVVPPPPAAFEAGITFSDLQAEALGLDWRTAYRLALDDLGVRRLRIPAYWSSVEPQEGAFDFSRLDWMLREAGAQNAKVVLAVGQKLPRWPECFIPSWAEGRQDAVLDYIDAVVRRYKDFSIIEAWQVENEPFFAFGECPDIPYDLVRREVEHVKALDSRPVIVTDSGELGTWFSAARLGDIVGTTMYRTTWKEGFGYLHYFLPAGFYEKKAALVGMLFGDPVWVTEMQLEPWVPSPPISSAPIEEQMRSMDFAQFRANVAYARASRLSPVYFWGAEWWYWMRENGRPEFLEYVRDNVFR